VNIRTYQPGDEAEQAAIYNEAARDWPRFKPASADEVMRRCQTSDFDPTSRLYAQEGNRLVGYATFQLNGRISFPFCRAGHEDVARPLFQKVLQTMAERGLTSAFAAYRADWSVPRDFFRSQDFRLSREVINFILDQVDMPTRPGRRNNPLTPLRREDLPAIVEMGEGILRETSLERLEQHFFHHPYFSPDDLYVLRSWSDETPLAVGILVGDRAYADPLQIDSAMPCFRLGAFGTEGLTHKRINGLFSFLVKDRRDTNLLGLDLMGQAATRFEKMDGGPLAAQVSSDASHLVRFYRDYFREQGRFPIYERNL
jgi:hypothetical protein